MKALTHALMPILLKLESEVSIKSYSRDSKQKLEKPARLAEIDWVPEEYVVSSSSPPDLNSKVFVKASSCFYKGARSFEPYYNA